MKQFLATIFALAVIIAGIIFCLWKINKKKEIYQSKKGKNCSDCDDFKKIKNIQLLKCQTCDNYGENNSSNQCCSHCQQNLISGKIHHHKSHCEQNHHHSHHHHCQTAEKQENISLNWLIIPVIIILGAFVVVKQIKKK
ncbi:hypothetical protein [endosymbiont GvMRE of Glomus versiforme]|uniref:hypothetical protein n=1 Tax=endosymbiont GvMRE of Glomus versiforme TaxID=2039283 RepID=UPI000EE37F59|nr:hypothetical protein [endosymbiont GvMRE of Glomus versiforme]RHZ37438.1 hypothetical protein GvMRE_I1g550 [endosymbiont GvMRE of Glomus versiforme]